MSELKTLDREVEKLLRRSGSLQTERIILIMKASEQERIGMALQRMPLKVQGDFWGGVVGKPREAGQGEAKGKAQKAPKQLPADLKEW